MKSSIDKISLAVFYIQPCYCRKNQSLRTTDSEIQGNVRKPNEKSRKTLSVQRTIIENCAQSSKQQVKAVCDQPTLSEYCVQSLTNQRNVCPIGKQSPKIVHNDRTISKSCIQSAPAKKYVQWNIRVNYEHRRTPCPISDMYIFSGAPCATQVGEQPNITYTYIYIYIYVVKHDCLFVLCTQDPANLLRSCNEVATKFEP